MNHHQDPFFDDQSDPVPVVDFAYPDEEPGEPDPTAEPDSVTALERRQAAAVLLELLVHGSTVREAGQKAFVLAFGLGLSSCRTQKELAARMQLTPGRVSQLLKRATAIWGKRSRGRTKIKPAKIKQLVVDDE